MTRFNCAPIPVVIALAALTVPSFAQHRPSWYDPPDDHDKGNPLSHPAIIIDGTLYDYGLFLPTGWVMDSREAYINEEKDRMMAWKDSLPPDQWEIGSIERFFYAYESPFHFFEFRDNNANWLPWDGWDWAKTAYEFSVAYKVDLRSNASAAHPDHHRIRGHYFITAKAANGRAVFANDETGRFLAFNGQDWLIVADFDAISDPSSFRGFNLSEHRDYEMDKAEDELCEIFSHHWPLTGTNGHYSTMKCVNKCQARHGETVYNFCSENAECRRVTGGKACECKTGYKGNGTYCEDIDECSVGTDTCSDSATCSNTKGSFTCTCNSGYFSISGDGTDCDNLNECMVDAHNCAPDASCLNLPGTFSCSCNLGFEGNGTTCLDIDECAGYSDNDCHTDSQCANNDGSFTCTCNPGFVDWSMGQVGTRCDRNQCKDQTHSCDANAECSDTDGSFTCACNAGYLGNGLTCEDINECTGRSVRVVQAHRVDLGDPASCSIDGGYNGCLFGPENVIDGVIDNDGWQKTGAWGRAPTCDPDIPGHVAYVQLDLGAVTDIDEVTAYHFHKDERQYCRQSVAISNASSFQGEEVNVFSCGDFAECGDVSHEGRVIRFNTQKARYVRIGSGRNNLNDGIHILEVKVGVIENTCTAETTCINTLGSYQCECPDNGYMFGQDGCSDVDECALGLDNCAANAHCVNTDGSFSCSCSAGYAQLSTGLQSRPISRPCYEIKDHLECLQARDSRSDPRYAGACVPIEPGTFQNVCEPLAFADANGLHVVDLAVEEVPAACFDVDECATRTHTCHANAACTNTDGSFTCACEADFEGDGLDCIVSRHVRMVDVAAYILDRPGEKDLNMHGIYLPTVHFVDGEVLYINEETGGYLGWSEPNSAWMLRYHQNLPSLVRGESGIHGGLQISSRRDLQDPLGWPDLGYDVVAVQHLTLEFRALSHHSAAYAGHFHITSDVLYGQGVYVHAHKDAFLGFDGQRWVIADLEGLPEALEMQTMWTFGGFVNSAALLEGWDDYSVHPVTTLCDDADGVYPESVKCIDRCTGGCGEAERCARAQGGTECKAKQSCADGYALVDGHSRPGWGTVNAYYGGGVEVESCDGCAGWCEVAGLSCGSYECSPSRPACSLNTETVPLSSTIEGDFVFCAREPQRSECAPGYTEIQGDVPGFGRVRGRGGGVKVESCSTCARWCAELDECGSYECSVTTMECSLNTLAVPTTEQTYADSLFCSKN